MAKYLGMQYNLSRDVHDILDRAGAHLASPREYADWVEGHLMLHPEDQQYSFSGRHRPAIHVATHDIDLPPLYGAEALTLIVPQGIHIRHRALGDSRLLFMDDFAQDSWHDRTIRLDGLTMQALHHDGFGQEDFIYAEALAVSGARHAFNRARGMEQMLGLISAGIHERDALMLL